MRIVVVEVRPEALYLLEQLVGIGRRVEDDRVDVLTVGLARVDARLLEFAPDVRIATMRAAVGVAVGAVGVSVPV